MTTQRRIPRNLSSAASVLERPGVEVSSSSPDDRTGDSNGELVLRFGDNSIELPVRTARGSIPSNATMTELGQRAGSVIAGVEAGVPALVSKQGRIIAAIVPLDPNAMHHLLNRDLSSDPMQLHEIDQSRSLAEVAAEYGVDLDG